MVFQVHQKRVSDEHAFLNFESLPVVNMLKISEERVKYLENIAKQIVLYNKMKEQVDSFNSTPFSLKDRYHLASKLINRINGDILFCNPIKNYITFLNAEEKALFAMLICDAECNYYNLYELKKSKGFSHDEAIHNLDIYYGIKSPRLIQMERYYQILKLRFEKNRTVGIFDNLKKTSR